MRRAQHSKTKHAPVESKLFQVLRAIRGWPRRETARFMRLLGEIAMRFYRVRGICLFCLGSVCMSSPCVCVCVCVCKCVCRHMYSELGVPGTTFLSIARLAGGRSSCGRGVSRHAPVDCHVGSRMQIERRQIRITLPLWARHFACGPQRRAEVVPIHQAGRVVSSLFALLRHRFLFGK